MGTLCGVCSWGVAWFSVSCCHPQGRGGTPVPPFLWFVGMAFNRNHHCAFWNGLGGRGEVPVPFSIIWGHGFYIGHRNNHCAFWGRDGPSSLAKIDICIFQVLFFSFCKWMCEEVQAVFIPCACWSCCGTQFANDIHMLLPKYSHLLRGRHWTVQKDQGKGVYEYHSLAKCALRPGTAISTINHPPYAPPIGFLQSYGRPWLQWL